MTDCQDLYTWIESSDYEWVDESYFEFGECLTTVSGQLNQLWRDNHYVYVVTSFGLDMFDIFSTNKVAYIVIDGGFTTVWGNDDFIYLGTYGDGVKYLEKILISYGNLYTYLEDYNYQYNTSSNNIKYLHGYMNTLAVITDIGIDILNRDYQGFKSTTSGTNFTKCFLTSKKEIYYIIQDSATDGVGKINSIVCDWSEPDIFYAAGTSFLPKDQRINDIFITENTSLNGTDNTLFVATNNGAYVLDEGTLAFDVYYIKGE